MKNKHRQNIDASPTRRGDENQKTQRSKHVPPRAEPELREGVFAPLGPPAGGDGGEDDVSEGFLGVAVLDASGGGALQEPVQMEVEPVRSAVVDVARVKNLAAISGFSSIGSSPVDKGHAGAEEGSGKQQ